MKKKLLLLALTFTLGMTMAACSNKDKSEKPKEEVTEIKTSATDIMTATIEGTELPNMMDVDDTLMKDLYNIDLSIIDNYSIKQPMMTGQPVEIAIFRVKDKKDVDTVKKALEARKETLLAPGVNYPSVNEAAEKSTILNNGNYVAFIMSYADDEALAKKLEENFNKATK